VSILPGIYSGSNRSARAINCAGSRRFGLVAWRKYKEKGYFVRKILSCSWCNG